MDLKQSPFKYKLLEYRKHNYNSLIENKSAWNNLLCKIFHMNYCSMKSKV